MEFLRNTWYVAAWSDELTDGLLARRILDEPLVFFRDGNGRAAALADMCPHRFAPLSLGRHTGDSIQCGYHGLRFGADGACVDNPHGNHVIPKTCVVKSYPLIELHGILWIWPGLPEAADPAVIPDFSYLVATNRKTVHGSTLVRANYQLINDNLMDASHTQYVHSDLLGTDAFSRAKHEVAREENAVFSRYMVHDTSVPVSYARYFDDANVRIDYRIGFRWLPASLVRNDVALTPLGLSIEEGVQRTGSHLMTPETNLTSHYFFAHTRNFRLDDAELDDQTRMWQKRGLTEQDKPIIEAAQARMGTAELDEMEPSLISIDSAAVRVRKVLAQLIAGERAASQLEPLAAPQFTRA